FSYILLTLPPNTTLFPYTTLFRSDQTYGSWSTPLIVKVNDQDQLILGQSRDVKGEPENKNGYLRGFDPKTGKELILIVHLHDEGDRKSTRLNSSHVATSYAGFCFK